MFSDVSVLSFVSVVCANLRSVGEVRFFVISQSLTFFIPHFGVSSWRLKCTRYMGHLGDVVH
jgi:hypothetical protein